MSQSAANFVLPEEIQKEVSMRGHVLTLHPVASQEMTHDEHIRWDCANDGCSAILGCRKRTSFYGGTLMRVCGAGPVTRRRPKIGEAA